MQVKGLDVIPGLRNDLESLRAQTSALQTSNAKLQVLLLALIVELKMFTLFKVWILRS